MISHNVPRAGATGAGGTDTDPEHAAARLRARLGRRLLRPADADFAAATRLWNAGVRHRPALVARCRDADEVAYAIGVARECGLPVSVRGGGHDWAGRALCADGLVVDLTGLRRVSVDASARVATVAGGATAADVLAAGRADELVVPTGTVGGVGMAGLTLAGGYGPLCGRHGLALDNLLGAEVVLADGSRVLAGPADDAELHWALRGGGGNFGVVTSLTYRLHRLPTTISGMIVFPLESAVSVLRRCGDVLAEAPDELTVTAALLPGPDGHPTLVLFPTWSGSDLAAGDRALDRLRRLGTPVSIRLGLLGYPDVLAMFDAGPAGGGNHRLLRNRWLGELSEAAAEVLVEAARELPSPYSALAVHHFHGAASRVAPADTAFGLRREHLLVEIIAGWPAAESPAAHRDWAERTSAALAPLALPGGYVNLLGPQEQDRVRLAYGDNWQRLLRAKQRYDPENVFASAVPALPPPPPC